MLRSPTTILPLSTIFSYRSALMSLVDPQTISYMRLFLANFSQFSAPVLRTSLSIISSSCLQVIRQSRMMMSLLQFSRKMCCWPWQCVSACSCRLISRNSMALVTYSIDSRYMVSRDSWLRPLLPSQLGASSVEQRSQQSLAILTSFLQSLVFLYSSQRAQSMSRQFSLSNYLSLVTFCSMMCVKQENREGVVPVSLKIPLAIDYFILPQSLYRNRQKCTQAISSFDTNFLSSFDMVSVAWVVGVSWTEGWQFLLKFQMFLRDMFWTFWVVFRTLGCSFLSDFSWANMRFSIDLPMWFMFLGEAAQLIRLQNFCNFTAVFICFQPRMLPYYWVLNLNLRSSSGPSL